MSLMHFFNLYVDYLDYLKLILSFVCCKASYMRLGIWFTTHERGPDCLIIFSDREPFSNELFTHTSSSSMKSLSPTAFKS